MLLRRASHRCLFVLGLLSALSALVAVEPPPTFEALQPSHPLRERVDSLLLSLRDERQAPLASADPSWFTLPIGRSDPDGCIRHWTEHLRRAIAELAPARRAEAVAALDALYRAGPRTPVRAACLLPAPSARADLADAIDRAFDRAEMLRFLHGQALLDDRTLLDEKVAPSARTGVASAWLGRSTDPAITHGPVAPGALRAVSQRATPLPDHQGRSVRWVRHEGLLLAVDPFGRVRWQRGIDSRAQRVVTGPGAAVVESPHALTVIDEDGRARDWPRPLATSVRAVGDGGAWFSLDERVFRMDLTTSTVRSWTLPGRVIGDPVIAPGLALWPTPDHLAATHRDGSVSWYAHDSDLTIAELHRDRHGVILLSDEACYRVSAPASAGGRVSAPAPAGGGDLARRLEDLVRGDRADEALAVVAAQPHELGAAARAWAARAQLARGVDAASVRRLLPGIDEAQLRARLLLAVAHPLADTDGLPEDLAAELHQLARAHPLLMVPGTPLADPLAPAHAWPHAIRLDQLFAAAAAAAAPLGLAEVARLAPADSSQLRDHDLLGAEREASIRAGAWTFSAAIDADDQRRFVITARHGGQTVWIRRLQSAGWRFPGVELAITGDRLLVQEGGSSIHVLVPASGRLLAHHRVPGLTAVRRSAATAEAVATLVPLHAPSSLRIRHADGVADHHFDSPPHWVISIAGHFVTAHGDGSVRVHDSDQRLAWPAELSAGPAPAIVGRQLYGAERRWSWDER